MLDYLEHVHTPYALLALEADQQALTYLQS